MTYGCGWQVAKMGKFVREKVDVSRAMRPQGESQPTLAGALSLDTHRGLRAPSDPCDEKYRVPSNHSTSVPHGHHLLTPLQLALSLTFPPILSSMPHSAAAPGRAGGARPHAAGRAGCGLCHRQRAIPLPRAPLPPGPLLRYATTKTVLVSPHVNRNSQS